MIRIFTVLATLAFANSDKTVHFDCNTGTISGLRKKLEKSTSQKGSDELIKAIIQCGDRGVRAPIVVKPLLDFAAREASRPVKISGEMERMIEASISGAGLRGGPDAVPELKLWLPGGARFKGIRCKLQRAHGGSAQISFLDAAIDGLGFAGTDAAAQALSDLRKGPFPHGSAAGIDHGFEMGIDIALKRNAEIKRLGFSRWAEAN